MPLRDYIINDITPLPVEDSIKDAQLLFSNLTYSHIPIKKEDVYIGCISETDAHCLDAQSPLTDHLYAIEGFYVRQKTMWLDILEAFAQSDSNIMPVLDEQNKYLGYYELNDIISLFSKSPFFSEPGGIIIVEKGYNDYSFSEVSQIVESNNAKLLGAFVSRIKNDMVQITIKVGDALIGDVIQTFRRYSYQIISGHEDDAYLENLKERSDYLNKYLNM